MKMKRSDFASLYGSLNKILSQKDKYPFEFTYEIAKNRNILKVEFDSVSIADKNALGDYTKEHSDLISRYSEKDERGNPKIIDGNYTIIDQVSFNMEAQRLSEKYKSVIDSQKIFMDKEIELDLVLIPKSIIPDIPAETVPGLIPIVKEDKK